MPPGRPKLVEGTTEVHLRLRTPLLTRLDLLLFSEAEGRVPYGARNRFFEDLIARALDFVPLDLAPYTGEAGGVRVLRAPAETVEVLKRLLETER